MNGVTPFSVEHLIDVAVVGGDQALAAHLEDGINDLAYAVIGGSIALTAASNTPV